MVAAKNGNEEAIVALALSNDIDGLGKQALLDVPALKKTAATILEQCSLLIPQ